MYMRMCTCIQAHHALVFLYNNNLKSISENSYCLIFALHYPVIKGR